MEHIETILAQLGNKTDPTTGAISAPIHLSATYAHPGLGASTGYDYTRTKNPTRAVLEEGLAELEKGTHAVATSSGMSAIQLAFQLFEPGAKILACRDLYGGSYRYFDELEKHGYLKFVYYNTEEEFDNLINETFDGVFVESPTNPLMEVYDIEAIAKKSKEAGAILIVDNTLLTPLRQRPLELGAQIVVHSGTKFLTGHNDILAGVVVTNEEELGERLLWLSNTTGPTLSPFDSWLFIRSLKTLPLRFNQQEQNAKEIVTFLEKHPKVGKVLYAGEGAMISFYLESESQVGPLLESLNIITYAESLGGVETLMTYPTTQTHADIPKELRESYGLTPNLLRIAVGIEDSRDLIDDLNQALEKI